MNVFTKWFPAIIIGLMFSSCNQEKQIDGFWIGPFQEEYPSNSSIHFTPRNLLQFVEDSIKTWSLNIGSDAIAEAVKFKLDGDKVLVYSKGSEIDTMRVVSINEEKLVVEFFDENRTIVFFKRIPGSPSPYEIDLVGKTFKINYNDFSDSIEFINHSLFAHVDYNEFNVEHWEIQSIGDYRFLLLGQINPPLFIERSDDSLVYLKSFVDKTPIVVLSELKKSAHKSGLIGKWVEIDRTRLDTIDYPIFTISLDFGKDSLNIFQREISKSLRWEVNFDGTHIYFPDKLFGRNEMLWEIIELSEQKLIIARRTFPYYSEADKEWIEFRRQE